MQAIRFDQTGDPSVLQYEDVPRPEPGPGQVRLKVQATGINFIDTYLRAGLYKTALPAILGQEAAGIVDAIGPDVTEVKVGDRVAAYAGDLKAYAEYAIAPAWRV